MWGRSPWLWDDYLLRVPGAAARRRVEDVAVGHGSAECDVADAGRYLVWSQNPAAWQVLFHEGLTG